LDVISRDTLSPPMPPDVTSVSLLICEKVLTEESSVCSAIRVADVFEVTAGPIVVHALLVIKTEPTADTTREHKLDVILTNSDGLGYRVTPHPATVKYLASIAGPGVYGGITVTIDLNVTGYPPGTYMLRVSLDGQEVSKAPLMLLPVRAGAPSSD
jgi:hypothetical protein